MLSGSEVTVDEGLHDLARRAGISVEWQDYAGHPHEVGPDVLRGILRALGLPADTSRELSASRRVLSRRTSLADLAPLVTGIAGRPTRLEIGGNEALQAQLLLENGAVRDLSLLPARGRLRVPAISEVGYHRIRVEDREIVLAMAPARCRSIEDVVPDARLWGVAAQVYGLRSPGDFGIGDAAGISGLAEAVAQPGADALAISPMHALFSADTATHAPYSPSSRLFLNPLYASPTLVFGASRVAQAMAEAGMEQEAGTAAEGQGMIDWSVAAPAKMAQLRAMFDSFLEGTEWDGPLGGDFARFRAERGVLLTEHAIFEALHAEQMPDSDWRQWPADLRDPRGSAVAAFAGARRDEVLFHTFLQWLAERSVAIAQARARQAGMRIGLIGDMAVGTNPSGSHAWSQQGDMLMGLTIGAPPDLLNPRGQNWGLTSFSPRALESGGFAPFIATIRAVMRQVGGVRIDHAMGLSRLWVVPEGASPADGAFLTYPVQDLLRLLALESLRQDTVVIGEDLGTVPEGFHEMLEQGGIHGMRVLWFERQREAGFNPPRGWERSAVAMTTTHDLPTVAGWWHGTDIQERDRYGRLGEGVEAASVHKERTADRPALWEAMVAEGVAEGDPPPPEETAPVVDAAVRFITRTESPLVLIPLEDLLGQEEQPNLPGTTSRPANWSRRLPVRADRIMDDDGVRRRMEAIAAERPRE